ncbi:MAG: hypothetical protein A2583_09855 [Bdellovibrionales bacterium RIFOXYD1_FULL_53_11]|nr:MAG: hypothetical protein A2583_09855 [Bdellovibrionales bacterium RIFOXYD1_FULL_53_11]
MKTMKFLLSYSLFIAWLAFAMSILTNAGAFASEKTKRAKAIDFDDEVVEGMNKRPLDSVSQLSEAGRNRKKDHLYRKRGGFKGETAVMLRELGYLQ